MNRKKISKIQILVFAVLFIFTSPVFSDYHIVWSTIDDGGGQSSGGPYVLTGTTGQPDAGYSAGGEYELLGGFWSGGPFCLVEFQDFARFSQFWLETGTDLPADLYEDNIVNSSDLKLLVEQWLCICPYNWPLK